MQAQEATEHATQIAIDGVQNIKTVKAYRLQKKVAGSYEQASFGMRMASDALIRFRICSPFSVLQETKNRSSQKSEHIIGIAYGIAQVC